MTMSHRPGRSRTNDNRRSGVISATAIAPSPAEIRKNTTIRGHSRPARGRSPSRRRSNRGSVSRSAAATAARARIAGISGKGIQPSR
ncbi:MAG: hypothetical protein D6693_03480 [Planctomycetota bacterium]|nr:MAG: hypothetical protein D6693_03480 [Planctomycetota bacterium]